MEGLMFVDGVYPDFSLLEEVLLPPYFESDPCSTRGDAQSEEIMLLAQSQYREQPLDATVGLDDSGISGRTKDSTLQYCRRTRRGGKRRSTKNRSSSVKVGSCCLPRNHAKKSQKSGRKMSCMTEIPERGIIYLLEESMNSLPKRDSNLEDDQVSMNWEHVRSDCVRNGRRMTPCSASMTSDAMELLNLINMQCSHLNTLGGDPLRIDDVDRRNGGGDGHPKMAKYKIPNCDDLPSASSNKPHKVHDSEQGRSPVIRGGLLSDDRNSSTSGGVSSVEREEDRSGDCSLLNTPTGYEVCVRRTPRKQRTPMKGVEEQDPAFQGIEFQMHLCFEKKCDDCRLVMTSFYSRGRSRRKSTKSRLRFKSTSLSSGSEDDQMPAPSSRSKRCASCKTQKTPLWRDAEDGTPLCNACGIRYKKYGMRCGRCWNIPKKDGKSCSKYCGCGGMFRAPV